MNWINKDEDMPKVNPHKDTLIWVADNESYVDVRLIYFSMDEEDVANGIMVDFQYWMPAEFPKHPNHD